MTGTKLTRTEREKDKLIAQLINEGFPPSVIDEELRLDKDYTHDWMICVWQSGDFSVLNRARKQQKPKKKKHPPLTATQKRTQKEHREKCQQLNSIVAKRYAGHNLERQDPWKNE